MKAITYTEYGAPNEVLNYTEVADPQPTDNEVVVTVKAASINPADWHIVRGDPYIARLVFGLRAPKNSIPGADIAGVVTEIGSAVTAYSIGDEVFGDVFGKSSGAFAERVCTTEKQIQPKPKNLSFIEAAAVPLAATTALQGLRDHAKIEPGNSILIIGASGGVGTFAVQLAKIFGAEVTGVCSTKNLELVTSLGADHVIDYTNKDFINQNKQYDVVMQLGGMESISDYRKLVKSKGVLLLLSGESTGHILGPVTGILKAGFLSPFVSQKLLSFTAKHKNEDLKFLSGLIESGKLKPLVTKTYTLEETPEAITAVETAHTTGKTVIAIE